MLYQISRNGQLYGPYTIEDLRRYVASGNVLLTDLAKSESMTEWIPVSEILSAAVSAQPEPTYIPPAYTEPTPSSAAGYAPVNQPLFPGTTPVQTSVYPDPPNLHWVICLILWFVTCTLFNKVWTIIQASWLQKVQPNSTALRTYFVAYAFWAVQNVLGYQTYRSLFHHGPIGTNHFGSLMWLGFIVALVLSRLAMRTAIEQHFNGPEPIGLQLDSILTVLFGGLYFQSQFSRINAIKAAARYGAPRPY